MIEFIKNWIIQVLVTVIFMILVDMILPNNNFKKYAKLATGLIVMIIIITPVFKLFDRGINVEKKIKESIQAFQEKESKIDTEKIEEVMNKKTIETYKEKLKGSIEKSIYKETGSKYTVTDITIVEDTESYDFCEIKGISIIKNTAAGNIKPVETIKIGKDSGAKNEAPVDRDVLNVLKNDFKIDSDAVKFVK